MVSRLKKLPFLEHGRNCVKNGSSLSEAQRGRYICLPGCMRLLAYSSQYPSNGCILKFYC
jgi:hypothetical protein